MREYHSLSSPQPDPRSMADACLSIWGPICSSTPCCGRKLLWQISCSGPRTSTLSLRGTSGIPAIRWMVPSYFDGLCHLMHVEERRGESSRNSPVWLRMGAQPFPPLPVHEGMSTPQPSLSSSLQDQDMVESTTTGVEELCEDWQVSATALIAGAEGQPSAIPSMGGSMEASAQDVVMTTLTPGMEGQPSASLTSTSTFNALST